jgi:phenylalanyl-tRNA synthetase alpha chain
MENYSQHFKDLTTVTACLELRDSLNNSGRLSQIKEIIKTVSPEEKKLLGAEMNEIKTAISSACDTRIQEIQQEQEKDNFTVFDPTFYSTRYKTKTGSLHPLSIITSEIVDIFRKLGFDVFSGQLVESQYHNFTSVNTPDYHPARDMQDTFFLKEKDENGENYVMRTQVTANAVRYGKSHKPPFKVIFPGLVFRNENIDATHDINFTQFDMWMVDKQCSMSQLITLIQQFFSAFYNDPDLKVRLRPSYFPFTQPSFEGDISCPFCHNQGCRVCKHTGWIEVFGAGPIHTQVLKNMGLDSSQWQGLAFGFGIDRLAQLKFKITGISQFYNGNIEFLEGKE